MLQSSVDEQIKGAGFLPDATSYGMLSDNGKQKNGARPKLAPSAQADEWGCSEKQRNFILKLAEESEITDRELDATSERLFAAPASALDRKQASRFIGELLAITGRETGNSSKPRKPATAALAAA